jgi:hypothetical protein
MVPARQPHVLHQASGSEPEVHCTAMPGLRVDCLGATGTAAAGSRQLTSGLTLGSEGRHPIHGGLPGWPRHRVGR